MRMAISLRLAASNLWIGRTVMPSHPRSRERNLSFFHAPRERMSGFFDMAESVFGWADSRHFGTIEDVLTTCGVTPSSSLSSACTRAHFLALRLMAYGALGSLKNLRSSSRISGAAPL